MGNVTLLDSQALTKVQSIILITIIVVAAVGGGVTYVLLSGEEESAETIRIGVLTDLDGINGESVWLGTKLAAEEINSEGGILGRQLEVIGADTDFESEGDLTKVSLALTRLITYEKVDFIIGQAPGESGFVIQDIISEHEKIFLAVLGSLDNVTQRVIDNYRDYKYFFRVFQMNDTSIGKGMTDSILLIREILSEKL